MIVYRPISNSATNLASALGSLIVFFLLMQVIFSTTVAILTVIPIIIAMILLYLGGNYLLYKDWLYVKIYFLKYDEINVSNIKNIVFDNMKVKSFIITETDGSVTRGSIGNREKFVKQLTSINPNIDVKL